jgi:aconitate hydratase
VLPLQFLPGEDVAKLGITGEETFDVTGLAHLHPQMTVTLRIHRADGSVREVPLLCRIDTAIEVDYYQHGGILPFVLRELVGQAA